MRQYPVILSRLCSVLLLTSLLAATFGCRAQQPPAGTPLSPDLSRRVEVLVRSRAQLPPNYSIAVGGRTPSEFPGFDTIDVHIKAATGQNTDVSFLLSKDGKTLVQMSRYDLSADPRKLVSAGDRPARGGPAGAPVEIVGFDDLECPFCARMHAELFPALLKRYGDKVHIVYRDYPLPMHPWAMRAAIDVNCIAPQSASGYWDLVDQIHAHASEYGGPDHLLAEADKQLDQATLLQAQKDHLKLPEVESCLKKQDETAVRESMKIGDALHLDSTPILFINGEKLEGAYPLEDVYRFIDSALVAEGVTPPPPYIPPTPVPPTPPAAPPAGSPKPGN